jgi:hypothetical protein
MNRLRHVLGASAIALMIAAGVATDSPAFAQILKYVDEQGVTHYVGVPDQVPERYRSEADLAVLPEAVRQPDHTASLRALADATTRSHMTSPRVVDDTEQSMASENARLQQAYLARQAARTEYAARRTWEAYQKGCRFNPSTFQDYCSGASFPSLPTGIRGALADRSRLLQR